MKKALLAIAAVVASASALAADGTIIMKNQGVLTPTGSTYIIPLYQDATIAGNATTGAGLLPGGVTVGLFNASDLNTPLATATLGTTAQLSPFIANPIQQTVTVTGHDPGTTAPLVIRAWTTSSGSFANAKVSAGGEWGEWAFTSVPLGGTPPGGGLPVATPTFTGWGNVNGSGFNLIAAPEPTTIAFGVLGLGALVLARRRK
jgi:MYXO-CTERM domain-containing protein